MILIADSGSTKTNWSLISSENVNSYHSIGLNPHFASLAAVKEEIQQVFENIDALSIKELYFFGSGLSSLETISDFEKMLKSIFVNAKIKAHSDIAAVAFGMLGLEAGLVGILGTGCNFMHWDGSQFHTKVPSLGFWLGDEGSGAWMGKELVKKYLRNELENDLNENFETKFGEFDRNLVFDRIKNDPSVNRYFATFTPFIKEHLQFLSMKTIVNDGFGSFVHHQIKPFEGETVNRIAITGSVAFHFQGYLKPQIRAIFPNVPITIAADPMSGLIEFFKK